MKQLILAFFALSIVAISPLGSHECKQMREQILQPVRNIASYLDTRPGLETLSGAGCLYVLQTLKSLPAGANTVRELGARGIEKTESRCTTMVSSVRYPCTAPELGESRCLPEAYSYCGEWAFSATAQPKYELAMALATQTDVAFDKAQQLCGSAMSWDEAGTASASNDLLGYLRERILPDAENLYGMACEN